MPNCDTEVAIIGGGARRAFGTRWTDGFAEGSVGQRPCGNWIIFLAGSGQWGPIAIQPKGDSKCHRCVCG